MIYRTGREVKEIYLGNIPISAVWVGDKLIRRSRVYIKASAVLRMGTGAWLTLTSTLTYGANGEEFSLTAASAVSGKGSSALTRETFVPTVSASPYMRRTAPTVTRPVGMGQHRADPVHGGSELPKQSDIGGFVHGVAIVGGEGEAPTVGHPFSGVQVVPIVSGEGEAPTVGHEGSPLHMAAAIPAPSDVGRASDYPAALHMAAATHGVSGVDGSAALTGAHYGAKSDIGAGDLRGSMSLTGEHYRAKPMYADAKERSARLSGLWGAGTAKWSVASSECSDGGGLAVCPTSAKALSGGGICGEHTSAGVGGTSATIICGCAVGGEYLSAALGGCSAAMVLRYEDEIKSDLDVMAIADIDGLGLGDFDTRAVQA